MTAYGAIYEVVRQIPYGKVATYGQVAELANLPRRARLVGYALYRVDMSHSDIPWHRVINAKGEISQSPFRQGSDDMQRSRLEQENVVFNAKGKIDLRAYQWCPEADRLNSTHPEQTVESAGRAESGGAIVDSS